MNCKLHLVKSHALSYRCIAPRLFTDVSDGREGGGRYDFFIFGNFVNLFILRRKMFFNKEATSYARTRRHDFSTDLDQDRTYSEPLRPTSHLRCAVIYFFGKYIASWTLKKKQAHCISAEHRRCPESCDIMLVFNHVIFCIIAGTNPGLGYV